MNVSVFWLGCKLGHSLSYRRKGGYTLPLSGLARNVNVWVWNKISMIRTLVQQSCASAVLDPPQSFSQGVVIHNARHEHDDQ